MTITLTLSEEIVASLRAEAAQQELSLEAHLEALLTDWYTFGLPATDDEMAALLNTPPIGCPVI